MSPEEFIQHHGIKGMKWGVRRYQPYPKGSKKKGTFKGKVKKAAQNYEKKVTKAREKRTEKTHTRNTGNKTYDKSYKQSRASGDSHAEAVDFANLQKNTMNAIKMQITASAVTVAASMGRKHIKRAYNKVTSPESIRMGKNIIQSVKRSPIRYVDGKQMRNVVNVGRKLIR